MAKPTNITEAVSRLRDFLKDHPATNVLIEGDGKENSDSDLEYYVEDALDEINFGFLPTTNYTIDTIPSWNALKFGATLQALVSNGILSSRNTFNYSDNSGINVTDFDKWGRFINWYNVLINKYQRTVTNIKRSENIDKAYGRSPSEYGDIWNDF